MNPPDVRFAADAMLQALAKWIRLLGYDCAAGDDLFGRKLIEHAVAERRCVLTRNRRCFIECCVCRCGTSCKPGPRRL